MVCNVPVGVVASAWQDVRFEDPKGSRVPSNVAVVKAVELLLLFHRAGCQRGEDCRVSSHEGLRKQRRLREDCFAPLKMPAGDNTLAPAGDVFYGDIICQKTRNTKCESSVTACPRHVIRVELTALIHCGVEVRCPGLGLQGVVL